MGTLPLEPPCQISRYDELSDALQHEESAFAVIANPTSVHVETALACIEAGCHVLLEKPVSHTLDGLDDLDSAAAAHAVKVLVGFQFRFHPALSRIRDLLESGAMGTPLHARVVWAEYLPSWHPWEDWRDSYAARSALGGGVHHTICHPFDYLRMLFGDPVGVVASFRQDGPLGLDVPESADILLRFGDGVAAQLHLDYWTRPTANRVEISCTDGSIHWDYITGDFRVWNSATGAWQSEAFPGVEARNDLFVAEARHFLEVIEGQAQPACTLHDGIQAVHICAAIEESAARNQMVFPRGRSLKQDGG
jgi:predicted dehydrogenase